MTCNCEVLDPGPSIATLGSCGGGMFLLFMAVLERFLRSQCDIEDPCNTIVPTTDPDDEYDFIVVGGGSAGSVVGSRLSEVKNWKVLVVEAGTNEPTGTQVPSFAFNFLNSSIDWRYQTEPEEKACQTLPGKRCSWPRGKVIGGTSVIHGMSYVRGSRKDYDDWEKQGNLGWSYKSVLPYFMKSEDNLQLDEVDQGYHGSGGLLPISHFPYLPPFGKAILEGVKELGQRVGDINGEHHTGFTVVQAQSKNGIRYSSARAFLRPALKRSNLHVMLNTTAARVLIDPSKKTAYGLEIIQPDGKFKTIRARKEIIISGGTINSPQILLLSGVGPKEDLAKVNCTVIHDLPGVGINLQDHVDLYLYFHTNETAFKTLNWAVATDYLLNRNGPMSCTGTCQVTGLFHSSFSKSSDDNPDLQMFFSRDVADCSKTGAIDELESSAKDGIVPKKRVKFIPVLLKPKSRGYITLKDTNPLSHPKIFAKYLNDDGDSAILKEGIKFAVSLSKTKAFEKYRLQLDSTPAKGCEELQFGSDEYWECALLSDAKPGHHQVGTCKMGPSTDGEAVVDHELKVHGLINLRVMDGSIIPEITSGNTYATIVMIAEKGSDMIKQKWLKQE